MIVLAETNNRIQKTLEKEKQQNLYIFALILKQELTVISAITRGCLSGRKIKARPLVSKITKHICKMARGSAKSRGLSPWKTPFDVGFMGAGHACPTEAISDPTSIPCI